MTTFEEWSILGIEPTNDQGLIREAYLSALPRYHPEDDPTGFMKLRAAYEAALASARKASSVHEMEEDEGDSLSPGRQDRNGQNEEQDDVCKEIQEILTSFPRRMDEKEWEKLISEHGQSLDQQEELSDKILTALMDGQYLPKRTWCLFDKAFSWQTRTKQLKERFPARYIEYVVNGIRYERVIRDEFFDFEADADEDFDEFIMMYHTLSETLRGGDLKEAADQIASGNSSLFNHPDYRLLVSHFHRLSEEYEKEREILEDLCDKWPEDPFFLTTLGETKLENEPEEALRIFSEVLESFPDHYGAKIGKAQAHLSLGFAEDAKADSYDILMSDPYNSQAMNVFFMANEALVPIFSERLEKDPNDMEVRYKLSSCKFNLGKYEESFDLIADSNPDEKNRAKHYELYADLFVITNENINDDDRETLLGYIKAWEDAETDRQRMRFLPEKYFRLGMDDVALEKAEVLSLEFPGDPELCRIRAVILRKKDDRHHAFAVISEGLEKSPGNAALLSVEALLFEEVSNYGEAVESANASLGSYPFNLEMWELLARIYDNVGQYEDVKQTVARAEQFGLSSDALTLMKAAALFDTEEDYEESARLFEDILGRDPYNPICLEKLGIYYSRNGHPKDALVLFDLYVEKHNVPIAYLMRGALLVIHPQISDRFSKARARADFRKALELDNRYAPAWYRLGRLAYEEGRMEEAIADYQLTLDIDPTFVPDVRENLAIAYNNTGDYLSAFRILDEGIALLEQSEDKETYTTLLRTKAAILFDRHSYKELLELESKHPDLEKGTAGSVLRMANIAYAYYHIYEDEKAEELYESLFNEMNELPSEERGIVSEIVYATYAQFLRYSKHDIRSAIIYYEKCANGKPDLRKYAALADAYKEEGNLKYAKKLYKKALKLKSTESEACTNYLHGECWYGLGQIGKAKECLERAINCAKTVVECPMHSCFEAEFALGLIALAEGDKETARAHYQKVLDTVPDRDYREYADLFE